MIARRHGGAGLRIVASLIIALAAFVAPDRANAIYPDEVLKDPKLEQRARELSAELRCVVCQNQSIDDSDAPLARDLRLLVRERLEAGDSNKEVLDFIVARYGEFVLLKPPFAAHTLILWFGPLAVLLGAIWLARGVLYGRAARPSMAAAKNAQLSAEEEARLKALLDEPDGR